MTMARVIELSKAGVPLYDGTLELHEEYCERAWDFFFSLELEAQQKAAAIKLRTGLSGKAYEAARELKHNELLQGTAGVTKLLDTISRGVLKE